MYLAMYPHLHASLGCQGAISHARKRTHAQLLCTDESYTAGGTGQRPKDGAGLHQRSTSLI